MSGSGEFLEYQLQLEQALRERDEARDALARLQGIGADGLMDGLDYGDYLAAVKARDEARADLQHVLTVCRQLWFMYGSREDTTHKIAWRNFKEMLVAHPPLVTEGEP